jgi:hypothetical protein
VKRHREGELETGQQDGIEVHRSCPDIKEKRETNRGGRMIAQMSRIAKIIRRGMRELLRKSGDQARRAVDKLAMGKRLQWVHGPFAAIVAAGALGPVDRVPVEVVGRSIRSAGGTQ